MGDKKTKRRKKFFIAEAPVRRFMHDQGDEIVGGEALGLLIKELESVGKDITKMALDMVKDQDRKKVTADDVRFAFYELGYGDWTKRDKEKKEKDKKQ